MAVRTDYVELGSDESCFAIRADPDALVSEPWNGSTLVEIPENVATSGDVLVLTGDQWGPFAVTTQVLDSPSEVAGDWEDVVEFSLATSSEVVVTELVNGDPTAVLISEPGAYRIRVSARGRSAEQLRDDDEDGLVDEAVPETPLEHYLIEAWHAEPSPPVVVRETSQYAQDVLAGPRPPAQIEGAAQGLAGSRAVGRDIDGLPGARELSGETGELTVSRTIPATARKLFRFLRYGPPISDLPGWSFMAGRDFEEVGASVFNYAGLGDHPDQLSGRRGMIRSIVVEEDVPRSRVQHWAWLIPPPGRDGGPPDERITAADSTVTTTYSQSKDAAGLVTTLIVVKHSGLPVEWLDDFRAWWSYQLAFIEHFVCEKI